MSQRPIRITILDDSTGEHCSACEGMAWGLPESPEFVREQLRKRYGEWVEVEFLDLAEPSSSSRFSDLARRIREENIPLPVVAFNGEPRLSGNLEYRMISDAVQTEMEIRGDG